MSYLVPAKPKSEFSQSLHKIAGDILSLPYKDMLTLAKMVAPGSGASELAESLIAAAEKINAKAELHTQVMRSM